MHGVERANSLPKDGDGLRKSLYCAMQSLYEKDKVFALQYVAADGGSKVSYQCQSEEQQVKAVCRRKARQATVKDSTARLGPPDKKQHLDSHGKVNKAKEKPKKNNLKQPVQEEKLTR